MPWQEGSSAARRSLAGQSTCGNAACRAATTIIALAGALGCEYSEGGDVEPPEPGVVLSGVDLPGELILPGDFSEFEFDGTPTDPAIVALREGGGLTIGSLSGSDSCTVEPAAAFRTFQSVFPGTTNLGPVIAYLETLDKDGRGTLRLVDFRCQPRSEPLPQAELPLGALGTGLLVRAGAQDLHFIDPWWGIQKQLSSTMTGLEQGRGLTWVRETEEVVVFGAGGDEAFRFGQGAVTELKIARESFLWVDANGLNFHPPPYGRDTAERVIDADACEAELFPSLGERTVVAYFSPCAAERLVLYEWPGEARYPLQEGASRPFDGILGSTYGEIRYLTDATLLDSAALPPDPVPNPFEPRAGTLWTVTPGEAPVMLGERARMSSLTFGSSGDSNNIRLIVDFDGTSGRLIEGNTETGTVREVMPRVVSTFRGLAFVEFADGTGRLASVPSAPGTPALPLGVGVPDFGQNVVGSDAFLTDFDGSVGNLYSLTFAAAAPRFIAGGVPQRRYGWGWGGGALVYLRDFDPSAGWGTLEASIEEQAAQGSVVGVSAWRSTTSPSSLLLYNQRQGESAGIWSAKVRCSTWGTDEDMPCPK